MKQIKHLFTIESMSAVLAWCVVSVSIIGLMTKNAAFTLVDLATTAFFLLSFIVTFLVAIRDKPFANDLIMRLSLMALQYLSIIAVVFYIPYSFVAILITIWSAQVPYLMPFRYALALSPLWSAPVWLIFAFYWHIDSALLSAILFWTFNVFALVMVNSTIKEKKARQETHDLNRELMATQALLSEATKQSERVRIARDIHDLLGHHLTALTINLQVAARISDGQAQQKIEQCHSLAKLLLSDVREAVSTIREKSTIHLSAALQALIDNVPELEVNLDCSPEVNISNVNMAEAILRCVQESITNSLRHSNASKIDIHLHEDNNLIQLRVQDNGRNKRDFQEGNGIKGMRERVMELGGKINITQSTNGFLMAIDFPEYL